MNGCIGARVLEYRNPDEQSTVWILDSLCSDGIWECTDVYKKHIVRFIPDEYIGNSGRDGWKYERLDIDELPTQVTTYIDGWW